MAAIDKTYIKSYAQYREIADWCKAQGTVIDSFGNKITPYNYIPHNWEYDDNFVGTDKGEYTEEYVNEWLDNVRKNNEKYKTEDYWEHCYNTFDAWCDYVDTWAEIPLWNTDHVFDIYLIKNCPIDWIQDRLKEQYGGGWSKEALTENNNSYDAIKNGTSVYDTYQRNGVKNPHFKINYKFNVPFKDDNLKWWIEVRVNNHFWHYDDVADYWYSYNECYMPKCDSWTSVCDYCYKGNMNFKRLRRLLSKWNLPEGAVVSFSGEYARNILKLFEVTIKK